MGFLNLSARNAISDANLGMRLETGNLAASTYITGANSVRLFDVDGRVLVSQLYGEVTTAFTSAGAPLVKYVYASTDPVVAEADLSGNSGSVASLAVGTRISLVGGDITTGAAVTASAAISYGTVSPMIVGIRSGEGWMGIESTIAASTAGVINWVLHYVPMEVGAICRVNVAIIT